MLLQVKGEYGLSEVLLGAGYNLATLMARYPPGLDWRDRRHWRCNNNAHPSRHGTYDNISMHPFETVFIKARQAPGTIHAHPESTLTRAWPDPDLKLRAAVLLILQAVQYPRPSYR